MTGFSLLGEEGDDWLETSGGGALGGSGNDRLLSRVAGVLYGETGNDCLRGDFGDDFMEGGTGKDVLASGAGNDTINPDDEYLLPAPGDGVRDVILVTKADLGAFTDTVAFFEDGIDQIRFRDAVKGGLDFRITKVPDPNESATTDTLLQIDQNRDGTYDANDYSLYVYDSDLSLHRGYLLT